MQKYFFGCKKNSPKKRRKPLKIKHFCVFSIFIFLWFWQKSNFNFYVKIATFPKKCNFRAYICNLTVMTKVKMCVKMDNVEVCAFFKKW